MKTIRFEDKKNIISEKVREERGRLGISQEQLAAKLQTMGVSNDQQAISKIERNARIVTDYELFCLAKIFNITVDSFFDNIS